MNFGGKSEIVVNLLKEKITSTTKYSKKFEAMLDKRYNAYKKVGAVITEKQAQKRIKNC